MIWSDHSREGHYLNQSNVMYIPKLLSYHDFFLILIMAIGLLILWLLFDLYYIAKLHCSLTMHKNHKGSRLVLIENNQLADWRFEEILFFLNNTFSLRKTEKASNSAFVSVYASYEASTYSYINRLPQMYSIPSCCYWRKKMEILFNSFVTRNPQK